MMKFIGIVVTFVFCLTLVQYSLDDNWREGRLQRTEFIEKCTKASGRHAEIDTEGRFNHLVCVGLREGNSIILMEKEPFNEK